MQNIVRTDWKLFLFEGIVFILLGFLAVALPTVSTISIALLIGWLFLIGGVVQGYRTFQARGKAGFWTSLVMPILAIIVGLILILNPIIGVLTLTILLATYFLIEGIIKIMVAMSMRPLQPWGWLLFSGILAIFLAAIIWSGWPGTALWVLGLIVGINMIFFGWSLILLALGARSVE